jgi:hypothetical protein
MLSLKREGGEATRPIAVAGAGRKRERPRDGPAASIGNASRADYLPIGMNRT